MYFYISWHYYNYLAVLWNREDVHSLALSIQRGDSPLLDGCLLHTVVEHHGALRVHGAFIQGAWGRREAVHLFDLCNMLGVNIVEDFEVLWWNILLVLQRWGDVGQRVAAGAGERGDEWFGGHPSVFIIAENWEGRLFSLKQGIYKPVPKFIRFLWQNFTINNQRPKIGQVQSVHVTLLSSMAECKQRQQYFGQKKT